MIRIFYRSSILQGGVIPDSVQQAEALPAPVQEGHGPDEGQSRGTGREILGLPRPFEQELKVRE